MSGNAIRKVVSWSLLTMISCWWTEVVNRYEDVYFWKLDTVSCIMVITMISCWWTEVVNRYEDVYFWKLDTVSCIMVITMISCWWTEVVNRYDDVYYWKLDTVSCIMVITNHDILLVDRGCQQIRRRLFLEARHCELYHGHY